MATNVSEPPVRPEEGAGPGEGESPSIGGGGGGGATNSTGLAIGTDPESTVSAGMEISNGEKSSAPEVLADTDPAICLTALDDSVENGAVITLRPCVGDDGDNAGGDGSGAQAFVFEEWGEESGAGAVTAAKTGQCLTAGWPFFTGVAFKMNGELRERYGNDYAVVLLNEAEEAVEFDLSFPDEGFSLSASITPRSMQTILV